MSKPKKKEQSLKLKMPFEDALKKALNTPLPKPEKKAKAEKKKYK